MFAMSGGRAKAQLLAGAMNARGDIMTASMRNWTEVWSDRAAEQGYIHRVFAVRVRNTGRMAITVERWTFTVLKVARRADQIGMISLFDAISATRKRSVMSLAPLGAALSGPELPHRMEAGDKQVMWAFDADEVLRFAAVARDAFNMPAALPIIATVELGNGRVYRSDRGWVRP